jgi:hypothetical protein
MRAEVEAARVREVLVRAELTQAEERAGAADHCAGLAEKGQVAALARAEVAERGQGEATRELTAARAEAKAAKGREQAAQEAANALRDELEGIRGRGGWRGVLLRLSLRRTSA